MKDEVLYLDSARLWNFQNRTLFDEVLDVEDMDDVDIPERSQECPHQYMRLDISQGS